MTAVGSSEDDGSGMLLASFVEVLMKKMGIVSSFDVAGRSVGRLVGRWVCK